MKLREFTLAELFDEDGNMSVECCRRSGDDATPGLHPPLICNGIPDGERQGILQKVNKARWRIDEQANAYCVFCVLAMGG